MAGYTSYSGRHTMVRTARGRAGDQSCLHCENQASHWATIHGRDGQEPEDYIPLCVPCHRAYDGCSEQTRARMSAAHTGVRRPEVGAKISASLTGRTRSPEIARKGWETRRAKASALCPELRNM